MHGYTQAAFAGRADEARSISASLEPVRAALRDTRPPDKPHAHQKYWQELLGQVGGRVRAPLMELTEEEKRATRDAFEECGLEL
jgi:4-hydroxy-tetrahydrodipicolinate synthase